MPQVECPVCSLKFRETDIVVQCIDCSTKKHAHCAKIDPEMVGKRHWRCKGCSRKKDPGRKPKSAVLRGRTPPSRKMGEMAAGDSSRQLNHDDARSLQDADQGHWKIPLSGTHVKEKKLEELVSELNDNLQEISKKNEELEAELTKYKLRVENLEQKIRKNMVEVWGIQVGEKDNVSSIVTRLFEAVNWRQKDNSVESVGKVKKSEDEFLAGIRLARVPASVPRTVIWINFLTNRDKDDFMNKWRALEQRGGLSLRDLGTEEDGQVKIETSLTPYKLQLFQKAVDYANELKYQRVGVRDGEIYMLKDLNGGPLVFIKSLDDFDKLAEVEMQRSGSGKGKAAVEDSAEERRSPGKSQHQHDRNNQTSSKEVSNKGNRQPSMKKR